MKIYYYHKAKEYRKERSTWEEVYDRNVDFFLKNGYQVVSILPDLPKGHRYYIVDKDL